jgi:MerR family transcriptional regulator, light-induced transcriptional regulator
VTKKGAGPGDPLTIGELAQEAGMEPATLRTWEARYGFPSPTRSGGGRRSYGPQDLRLLLHVIQLRQTGLSLVAAIATARKTDQSPEMSFFAHVRRETPGLQAQILPKRIVAALSWAIEDELCARADRPVLFAGFQRETTYRRSENRWRELARTAARTTIFADFPEMTSTTDTLLEVPLPADSPALREWAVICDAPDYPACVVGWELPSPVRLPDDERRFETMWSLDGRVVREASLVAISFVDRLRPDLAVVLADELPDTTTANTAELRRATSLFSRMLAYA